MGRWVINKQTGTFLRGGMVDVSVTDPATEELVTIPDHLTVDVSSHRYDAAAGVRARSPEEETADTQVARTRELDEPRQVRVIRALIRLMWEQLPPETRPTLAVLRQRYRDIYLSLGPD